MRGILILFLLAAASPGGTSCTAPGTVRPRASAGPNQWVEKYHQAWTDLKYAHAWGYRGGPAASAAYNDEVHGSMVFVQQAQNFALIGKGYFKVLDKQTQVYLYTRSGNFVFSSDWKLVTPEGYELVPNLQVSPTTKSVRVSKLDGTQLSYTFDAGQATGGVYRFKIFRPVPASVVRRNKAYFEFDKTEAVANPRILQGYLEASNVHTAKTLYRLWNASARIDRSEGGKTSPRTELIRMLLRQKLNYDAAEHERFLLRRLLESVGLRNMSTRVMPQDDYFMKQLKGFIPALRLEKQ